MGFKFYRGDSRPPKDIKQAGGFYGWVPLSVEQARLLIKKASNESVENDKFPDALKGALQGVAIKKTLDLQQFIKYTKNKSTTPQVSTAYDKDCGGQANGKDDKGRQFVIYEIEFDGLNILQKGGVTPAKDDDFPHTGMFPKVVISGTCLADATVVGVMMKDELAFLTGIPLANIKQHNEGGTWTAM